MTKSLTGLLAEIETRAGVLEDMEKLKLLAVIRKLIEQRNSEIKFGNPDFFGTESLVKSLDDQLAKIVEGEK